MTVTAPQLEGPVREVEADGFRIRYWEQGQGEPLVFIHGASGPQTNAGLGLELLARNWRVISLEMPGFGESALNTRTNSGREMAATLAKAVAAIGIDKYAVGGTSLGAIIALWWAIDFGQNVTSVVLEAPAAFRADTIRPANLMTDINVLIRAFNARPQRKPWLADFKPGPMRDPELYVKLMGPDRDEGLVENLSKIAVPVLVLMGTKDQIISPDEGRHYKEFIPDCYLMMVYDAAHDLKGDRPEAFADVVGDFLKYGPKFLNNHKSTIVNP